EDGREVDGGLAADEPDDARREALAEGVARDERDPQAGVGEERVPEDERGRSDQPELLADDREDHVRVGLGQVVHLLDALAEAVAADSTGAESDQGLDGLETGALGVVPRVEEAEDARAPVRLEPDRREPERAGEPDAGAEDPRRRPGDE